MTFSTTPAADEPSTTPFVPQPTTTEEESYGYQSSSTTPAADEPSTTTTTTTETYNTYGNGYAEESTGMRSLDAPVAESSGQFPWNDGGDG